jgi:polar amino acid transport system substrate-binding protein
MSKISKVLSMVGLASVAMFIATGCGAAEEAETTKTLRMVTEATFPPYEFREGGKIVGIDVDIVTEAARRIGYEVTIEDMTFNSVIAAVQSGKADIAASGITVTEERKKSVNFTIPYVTAKQVILVPKDSPIQSAADLKGKRIGVQQSTTGDIYVTENIGTPERFENSAILVATLVANKLDAGVLDGDPAKEYVKANPQLHILTEALTFEDYAFAISKKNPELLAKFNKAMQEMFDDGTIAAIFAKYADKQ